MSLTIVFGLVEERSERKDNGLNGGLNLEVSLHQENVISLDLNFSHFF